MATSTFKRTWIYGPALADALGDFARRHPAHREAITDLVLDLAGQDLRFHHDLRAPSGWKWPVKSWDKWTDQLAPSMAKYPSQVTCQLLFRLPSLGKSWLQVSGNEVDGWLLAFGDQAGAAKPNKMRKLGWEQNSDFANVWDHQSCMRHVEGALDRAAQLMALVLGLQPSHVELKKAGPH